VSGAVLPIIGLGAAYLLGSVPAAYLAGRARGVDLRAHGSGNLGATNALRVLGWKVGLPVFLFDALKGFVPAYLFWRWFGAHPHWSMAYGLAAIVGHVRPVFLLGRGGGGGKGVATAAGVFLGLAPFATAVALAVFAAVVAASGYVSLGSLAAAAALVVSLAVTAGVRAPVFALGAAVAAFVFWSHRANIGRLRRGEESRVRRRRAPAAADPRVAAEPGP
jgi:glycerol-3-phosphate acyltransferase PlsY